MQPPTLSRCVRAALVQLTHSRQQQLPAGHAADTHLLWLRVHASARVCCGQSFVQHLSEAVPQWTISEIYLEEPLDKSSAYIADWVHDGRSDSAFGFTMQTALRRAIRVRRPPHAHQRPCVRVCCASCAM